LHVHFLVNDLYLNNKSACYYDIHLVYLKYNYLVLPLFQIISRSGFSRYIVLLCT
jgi:hypothetical protein